MRFCLSTAQAFEVEHIGQQPLQMIAGKFHVREMRASFLF